MLLFNHFAQNNYIQVIFWYWFIDMGKIFPTSFEFMIYFVTFLQMSYVLTVHSILGQFIAQVIDAQISFTPSVSLKKNDIFKERLHKLIFLQKFLLLRSILSLVSIFYFFVNFGEGAPKVSWTHFIFLSYPGFENVFKILIQINELQNKLKESRALPD